MRDIDRQTYTALGISEYALMCRAGEAAFQQLVSQWPEARRILVLCGTGNNGGDGWVLAGRHAGRGTRRTPSSVE